MIGLICSVLNRDELIMMRVKALEGGVWFKVLSGVEWSIVNLTIRVVEKVVKSSLLVRLMVEIINKLKEAI